jgi:hypothetical protein
VLGSVIFAVPFASKIVSDYRLLKYYSVRRYLNNAKKLGISRSDIKHALAGSESLLEFRAWSVAKGLLPDIGAGKDLGAFGRKLWNKVYGSDISPRAVSEVAAEVT